ncbi:peptidoglycan-recognition protein 2 [Tribolium castaneum]|uniref:Peptidoglycan-recognition protein n=1 Tax=Tribolium castaneum TaxID=7070 RepID=D7ELY4_TRICA|nr:PREDICTED: peptidoglycan-recognition protein 2 [Tribolium castaneum]EFA12467.1 Peptidoglycan-recognition protein SA-like Protein [Tribolium castaneum]|eukprot:XP_008192927.1 PREDICTED: peptidoglycan-recognition protein 2 [Tribolium castaneum]
MGRKFVIIFSILHQILARTESNLPAVCPEIVSRTRWGARTALEVDYALIPVENVVVHHTVTNTCSTEEECAAILRNIQNFHMENLDFHDIGYNFLVGGDGQIYEGAGWHKVGAHTRGYNSRSLGLGFIGNYTTQLPNKKQIQAAKDFLQCGVELGELGKSFKLFGARQVSATESPGLKLYRELQNWPHFTRSPPK